MFGAAVNAGPIVAPQLRQAHTRRSSRIATRALVELSWQGPDAPGQLFEAVVAVSEYSGNVVRYRGHRGNDDVGVVDILAELPGECAKQFVKSPPAFFRRAAGTFEAGVIALTPIAITMVGNTTSALLAALAAHGIDVSYAAPFVVPGPMAFQAGLHVLADVKPGASLAHLRADLAGICGASGGRLLLSESGLVTNTAVFVGCPSARDERPRMAASGVANMYGAVRVKTANRPGLLQSMLAILSELGGRPIFPRGRITPRGDGEVEAWMALNDVSSLREHVQRLGSYFGGRRAVVSGRVLDLRDAFFVTVTTPYERGDEVCQNAMNAVAAARATIDDSLVAPYPLPASDGIRLATSFGVIAHGAAGHQSRVRGLKQLAESVQIIAGRNQGWGGVYPVEFLLSCM